MPFRMLSNKFALPSSATGDAVSSENVNTGGGIGGILNGIGGGFIGGGGALCKEGKLGTGGGLLWDTFGDRVGLFGGNFGGMLSLYGL